MKVKELIRTLLGSSHARIPGAEAVEQVKSGSLLIDVRHPAEFERGHIEGAVNIPLGTLPEALPATTTSVVVYCASGRRSRVAKARLEPRVECHDLGPISAWPSG